MPYFLVIKNWPLFVKYIYKCKTSKYLNVVEVLVFVDLDFLGYDFLLVFTFYKEPILKLVDSFYCFSLEVIRKFAVNKHYIFHDKNSFLSLFDNTIFLYIYRVAYFIAILCFLQKMWNLTKMNFVLLSTYNTFIK